MRGLAEGVPREIHAELDSTSAECLRRARAGQRGSIWILARSQTAARGRRGRAWVSPPGNFAASLLMPFDGPPAQAALRSFVAALALRDALAKVTSRPELFAFKWPNDVLLAERKLAGILIETAPGALVIGIGVNLISTPDPALLEETAVPATSLRDGAGITLPPEAFLDQLAPAFAAWEARLMAEGFPSLRAAWLAGAARRGEMLTARMADRSVTGRWQDIDETGALVLETGSGQVTLHAADVHFPQPQPTGGEAHAARR